MTTSSNSSSKSPVGDSVLAEPAQSAGAVLPCERAENDERFVLRHRKTGRLLRGVRYRIVGASVDVEGTTDSEGRTERVHTGTRAENLKVYILHDDPRLGGSGGDWAPC